MAIAVAVNKLQFNSQFSFAGPIARRKSLNHSTSKTHDERL